MLGESDNELRRRTYDEKTDLVRKTTTCGRLGQLSRVALSPFSIRR